MSALSLHRLKPVLVAGAVAAALAIAPGTATAATGSTAGYAGDAYGTTVVVGTTVRSGQSALVAFGCGTPAGFHRENSTAAIAVDNLLSTGTITATGDTSDSPTRTVTSATTQNASLLGGLVTATLVKSVSTASLGAAGYGTSAAGSTFTGLKVLGVALSTNPAPNTRIDLPGIGYVVANEQISKVNARSATLTVNALHLVVNQTNIRGFAVGTTIIVSHARSTLTVPTGGFLSGTAFGSQVKIAGVISSGPTFPQPLPCLGTNGQLRTNTGVGITLPGVLTSGTITDTARGSTTATTATGETTSTVERVNLLGGLVTATAVKADATATRTEGVIALNDNGSTFASITVNGQVLDVAQIGPNTRIVIPAVGTLYLHRTIKTANQVEVRMIELVVTQTVGDVLAGTNIQVAVARVAVK